MKSLQIAKIEVKEEERKLKLLQHEAATFIRTMISQFAQQTARKKKKGKN